MNDNSVHLSNDFSGGYMKCENFFCDNYCESKTNNCTRYSGGTFDDCVARKNFRKLAEEKFNNTQQLKPKMPSKDEFIDLAMEEGIGGESAGYCYDLFARHFGH